MSPVESPVVNHFWRCGDEPCVHVRVRLALGLLLDAVVADRRRRVEGIGDLGLRDRL